MHNQISICIHLTKAAAVAHGGQNYQSISVGSAKHAGGINNVVGKIQHNVGKIAHSGGGYGSADISATLNQIAKLLQQLLNMLGKGSGATGGSQGYGAQHGGTNHNLSAVLNQIMVMLQNLNARSH